MKTLTLTSRTEVSVALKLILAQHAGRFVTLTGTKKDGSPIMLNGQVVASPKSHSHSPSLLTIRKSRSGDMRTIDLKTLRRVAMDGSVITFR